MRHRSASSLTLAVCVAALVLPTLVAGRVRAASSAPSEATGSQRLMSVSRSDAGVPALNIDPRLEHVARAQSEQMAQRGAIEHNEHLGPDVSSTGVDWRWLGENVGVGPDAELIHEGFLNSPHHHDVMVHSDATHIGVGAVVGDDGRLYITHVYAKEPGRPQHTAAVTPVRKMVVHAAAARLVPELRDAPSADPNAVIHGVVRDGVFARASAR